MILTSSAAFTCLLNPGARKIGLSSAIPNQPIMARKVVLRVGCALSMRPIRNEISVPREIRIQ